MNESSLQEESEYVMNILIQGSPDISVLALGELVPLSKRRCKESIFGSTDLKHCHTGKLRHYHTNTGGGGRKSGTSYKSCKLIN